QGQGQPQFFRHGGMIKRHQGRTLAACFHVGAAEIIDHIDAGQPGQQRAVTDLPGPMLGGPMQDGLAVKSKQGNLVRGQASLLQQRLHRLGMGVRQKPLGVADRIRHRRAFRHIPRLLQRRPQKRSGFAVIGNGEPGPRVHHLFAIGLDQGGIHAIERGAAHQADDFRNFRHLWYLNPLSATVGDVSLIASHSDLVEARGTPMHAAPSFRSEFLRTFVSRGAFYACSEPWEELDNLFDRERVTAYIGFDCTADSLHIGHMIQLMTLRRLQQAGHKPILLMGGGTTKVGDPSGKDETRQLLSTAQIEANKQSILTSIRHLLKFGDGPSDALMADNAEWLDKLEYIPFLREVGRHFSVNQMLTRDSVKLRLEREQPLSFLEFNYSIMQAYDFVELYKRYGCRLQSSGSDQWGNIVSGIELGRRMENAQL